MRTQCVPGPSPHTRGSGYKATSPSEVKIPSHVNAEHVSWIRSTKARNASPMKGSERVEKSLGYNILDICFNNNSELEKMLKSTKFVQIALLVSCKLSS